MPPFRSVHGGKAGPKALGILVPPGPRTVVVLRPRALTFDLVLARASADGVAEGFFETSRQSAGLEAHELNRALLANGGAVDVLQFLDGFHVQALVGTYRLLACARQPGQAYRPFRFSTLDEAQWMAGELEAVIRPAAEANQELYTNMSQFGR